MNAEELAEIINASCINILVFDAENGILHCGESHVLVNGDSIQVTFYGDSHEED